MNGAKAFEVEQKYRLTDADATLEKLNRLGVRWEAKQEQVDRYFNHPARDFARTDEALRIRSVGDKNFVTYKGPKHDSTTKTRPELELPLAGGSAAAGQYGELLEKLGFRPVAEVRKHRRPGKLAWADFDVEIAWDQVERVGPFVELELLADEAGLAPAQTALASLARELDLQQAERRSYLELLLAAGA